MLDLIQNTLTATRAHLLSLRNAAGHWEGELSSSALSTATAIVALTLVDQRAHEFSISHGVRWLVENQNDDGGWGDTAISKTNLSTALLCWSALTLVKTRGVAYKYVSSVTISLTRTEAWITSHVGSLEPDAIAQAVVARYGKDKTFSVPILMTCAIGGRLGSHDEAWRRVLSLPFELAALPRDWFGAIGLPVVSYALPALIAIGYARFFHARPAWWNPLGWLRGILWPRISPMLKALQPSTGGYLEATPLTSFVTMALASADEKYHPCVPAAVQFLKRSQREDGAWPIDTNLATWATTLSVKALCGSSNLDGLGSNAGSADALVRHKIQSGGTAANSNDADRSVRAPVKAWLLAQQYKVIHPFTNAAPGAWAWTDLPGGVPDADDTSSALIALWHLCDTDDERRQILPEIEAGIAWLIDLQNRDGGMPTFCRGWGALPFDRSTPEITAHALGALLTWAPLLGGDEAMKAKRRQAKIRACQYLARAFWKEFPAGWPPDLSGEPHDAEAHTAAAFQEQRKLASHGGWIPLWFGNEHTHDEANRVFGTAQVLNHLLAPGVISLGRLDPEAACKGVETQLSRLLIPVLIPAIEVLLGTQNETGGWGGGPGTVPSIEETAVAVEALARCASIAPGQDIQERLLPVVQRGAAWLCEATQNGTRFPSSPIGLYFARLWYHEKTYPVLWTLGALQQAVAVSH